MGHSASGARADEFLNPARTRVPVVSVFLEESAALRALSGELVHRLRCFMVSLPPPIRGPVHIAVFGIDFCTQQPGRGAAGEEGLGGGCGPATAVHHQRAELHDDCQWRE